MRTIETIAGYPFVSHVNQENRPVITNPADFLAKVYGRGFHSALPDMLSSGVYKRMGYCYDFGPLLQKYLYKQHGMWLEVYAPNKTSLRAAIHGHIEKIVDLK
jgi:hypothetical protein